MIKSNNPFLIGLVVIFVSCQNQPDNKSSDEQLTSSSQRYDDLLADKLSSFAPLPTKSENAENPSNEAKVKLGHMLYYDTRLSKDGNNSCNSCHNLNTYGVDRLPKSPGDLGKDGDRNSPTTLNAALHFKQFWDGRAADVEEQAGGPVLNPVEMNMPSESAVEKRLLSDPAYADLFAEAFPNEPRPVSFKNMQKAIGSFERELLTPSRFDQYLQGDKDALSLKEKKGLLSFTLVGCTTCHTGALLGGNQFQRFGVHKPYWEATKSSKIDKGLAEVSGEELDEYMFKVPSLRNIGETYPYFHDGSVQELEEAIKIMAEVQLDYTLNKEEVDNITAFMESLTGEVPSEYKSNPFASAAQ